MPKEELLSVARMHMLMANTTQALFVDASRILDREENIAARIARREWGVSPGDPPYLACLEFIDRSEAHMYAMAAAWVQDGLVQEYVKAHPLHVPEES